MISRSGFRRLDTDSRLESRRVYRVGRRVETSRDGSIGLRPPALGRYIGGCPQARVAGCDAGDYVASLLLLSSCFSDSCCCAVT